MKIKIILFVCAFFFWMFLNWLVGSEYLVLGIVVGLLVTFMTADLFKNSPGILKRPWRYLWLVYYVPLFTWECIKANVDGVYRVVHPDLPIKPGIVKVKTTLKSDAALTFLANSLTLKPGTMTVDVDKESGFLYIHWADVKTQDPQKAAELIVGKFERILKRIFE